MSTSRFNLRALRDRDELTAFGKELAAEIKTDDVPSMAAAVAFKIVLALFPALLAAVAIFALVTDPNELSDLLNNLPADVTEVVRPQLEDFIRTAGSGGIAFGGIAAGLWAASSAAFTLDKALTRAYDETEERKLVGARASALAVTAALLVALIVISVLLVAGGTIEDSILASLPLAEAARTGLDIVSTLGRYLVAILLLMVLFAFIYWIGPDFERRPCWAWITPGAALAVVTWLIGSALFGFYVANFGSYTGEGSVYGALGNAIVFMLWLQLSMLALLLGAEVNQVLMLRARRQSSAGDMTGAGSAGADAAGSADGSQAAAADGGDGAVRTSAGDVRAASTPTGRRSAAVRPADRRADDRDGDAPAGRGAAPRPRSTASVGTVSIGSHDADNDTSARMPTATLVGAGIAALSSLVGLTGLLRRLKG